VAEVARHTAVGASAHCMDTSPEAVATFAPWAPSPSPTPNSRPRRPSAEQWDLVAPTGVEVHYSSESAADRGDTASGPRLARTSRGVLGSSCPISTTSGGTQCAGDLFPNGDTCDDCCSHSSGYCATACAFSHSAPAPAALSGVVVTVSRVPARDAERPLLVERHPARLLRPPIV
jgi:hypothetical protein